MVAACLIQDRRPSFRLVWLLPALFAFAPSVRAQSARNGGALEAGAASVTVDGYARTSLTDLASTLWGSAGRASASAAVTAARFTSGTVTGYGELHGAFETWNDGIHRAAIGLDAGSGAYSSRVSSRYALASAVLGSRSTDTGFGGWLSIGAGVAQTDASNGAHRTAEARAGSSARAGDALLSATVAVASADSHGYTEATLHGESAPRSASFGGVPALSVAVDAGVRSSAGRILRSRAGWLNGSVALRVVDPVSLVARAGYEPSNPLRGTPGAAVASISLRVPLGPRAATVAIASRPAPSTVVGPSVNGGERVITLSIPGAASVELMADFTGWTPVAMNRTGSGLWTRRFTVPTGSHRVNIRTNGGPWTAPPDVPSAADEFGGTVGVLFVP